MADLLQLIPKPPPDPQPGPTNKRMGLGPMDFARVPSNQELYHLLEARVGALHLRRRLGIESDRETRFFRPGPNFWHPDKWYSVHSMIRSALRLTLLHERARRNALEIQVRRHNIPVAGLPAAFDGFTILQLSDLHLDMNADFPRTLGERVKDLDYDVCVVTGDFRYRTVGPFEAALAAMHRVRMDLKDEVYGILGNHDSIRMVPAFEEMGIRMLINESMTITRGNAAIHVVGIDDPHYYRVDNLDRACNGIDHDNVSLLLAHTPEVYKHAAHAGFNVMLCGHTHGGQICLPGGTPILYDAKCPRRMASGPWTYHQLAGYTSVGAGSSIVDVRLNSRPEITLHRLQRL